ncbi:MAG: MFS transporter [Bryobacterales bacterium]|nr:MFS transporter [Bryobacterales bacterium]
MKIPRLQYVIAALLFLATMLNYLDRVALGVVSVEVRKDFALTDRDYGHIVALFLVAYAIMYAGSGFLIDRWGTKRGFAVFIAGWSVAQVLHAFAVGKWSLAACRFGLGLFEPGNWPAAAKAVSEWFPPARRALGIGIFNAGSSLGGALAPPLVGYLTLQSSWRGAFIATGLAGFIWLVAWLILYAPPHCNRWITSREYSELKDHVRPPGETTGARPNWRAIVSQRGCWVLICARFFTDPVSYFMLFWLPAYLRAERGFDLAMVSQYAWVPFIFGDIGYITGGWLSGRLMDRGWPMAKARKTVLLLGAAIMPLGILAPMAPSGEAAIAVMCIMAMGHSLWISNLLTIPTDLFKANEVGLATGFTGMGGAIGGAIANLFTGNLVATAGYAPIFWMAGLMHPLSLLIVYRLLPDREFARRQPDTPRSGETVR